MAYVIILLICGYLLLTYPRLRIFSPHRTNTTPDDPGKGDEMADAAFKTAPFASYTTAQLREFVDDPDANMITRGLMKDEIARREAVAAGDVSQMTSAERLRFHAGS